MSLALQIINISIMKLDLNGKLFTPFKVTVEQDMNATVA